MSALQAAVLGFVQGITEYLPISSKTHLVVVPALLGWEAPSLEFIVLLHLGTFVGLVIYFFRRLWGIASGAVRGDGEARRMVGLLVVATIPAAVMGFLFEETFERLLADPRRAAFALLATAVLLVAAEWAAGTISRGKRLPRELSERPLMRHAVAMGLAQAVALLPGVSRSGSTMASGLVTGLRRPAAAEFSFLMALPAIAGANILETPELVGAGFGTADWVGFAAALVSGYLAVAFLLRYLRRHSFLPFAIYCVVFGVGAGLALS